MADTKNINLHGLDTTSLYLFIK